MKIKVINRQIQLGKTHAKAFWEFESTHFSYHVTTTLEEYGYDATIKHVGINDILSSDAKVLMRYMIYQETSE